MGCDPDTRPEIEKRRIADILSRTTDQKTSPRLTMTARSPFLVMPFTNTTIFGIVLIGLQSKKLDDFTVLRPATRRIGASPVGRENSPQKTERKKIIL